MKQILLYPCLTIIFLMISNFSFGQTTIQGTVSSKTSEALIGVNIIIENTTIGTTTDVDGDFKLIIPEDITDEINLIVTYSGYSQRVIQVSAIGTIQEVNITLDEGVLLSDIVVSARHRQENIQNVGQSIAAISDQLIRRSGISDFSDLAALTPGLDVADRGPNRNEQAIRGIARVTPINDLILTPNLVANYLDEIPINSPGSNQRDLRLFDVNRVEVLRGPQGTLFGEGAAAGAIRTFTNDPNLTDQSFRFQSTLSSTSDSADPNYRVNGMANLPLIKNKLGIRLVGMFRQDAGFIDNMMTEEKDANDFESLGGRATLLWLPSDGVRIRASYSKDINDIGADWVVFSGDGRTFSENIVSRPGPDERSDDMDLANLKADFDVGSFTLSSISGYFIRDFDRLSFDPIQTNNVIRALLAPTMAAFENDLSFTTADVITKTRLKDQNFSQEFRAISNLTGPFNVTFGAFYKNSDFQNTFDARSDVFIPYNDSDLYSRALTQRLGTQVSAYGELMYDITPKLRAIGGLRWFKEDQTDNELESGGGIDFTQYFTNVFLISSGLLAPDLLADNAFAVTTSDEKTELATHSINTILPKFALEFRPTANVMVYGSYSQGARIGGTNSQASVDDILVLGSDGLPDEAATMALQEEALTYDDDRVTTYDLGVKTSFNDNLILNAGLYYSKWDDIQTMLLAKSGFAYFENVGNAHTSGLEIETVFKISDVLSFNGGLNVTQAEFDEEAVVQNVAVVDGIPMALNPVNSIMAGDRIPNVPSYTFNAGLQASVPMNDNALVARFDYFARGASINRIEIQDEDGEIDSYGIANLRVGYQASKWSITAFSNNLFNKQLPLSIQRNLAVPAESELYINRPREIGLTLDVNF